MLILDIILLIIILICIAYCWILNRRIQDLQSSRIEFAKMIKELNVSIVKAESSVAELSELSTSASRELNASTESARTVISELKVLSDIGNNIVNALDKQTRFAANLVQNEQASRDLFSEEDLVIEEIELKDDGEQVQHVNKLKNLVTQINNPKNTEESINLTQLGYYDSLRKISANKK